MREIRRCGLVGVAMSLRIDSGVLKAQTRPRVSLLAACGTRCRTLGVVSPASYLPVSHCTTHHDDNGLNI